MAPIFTGLPDVGLGVEVFTVGVAIGVAEGVVEDVLVWVGVAVTVFVGVEVLSSPPPPQAGSKASITKLRTVKATNQRFTQIPPILHHTTLGHTGWTT
jgi:hypothetical protein